MLISWRLIGMAAKTPSAAITPNQTISEGVLGIAPVSTNSAGTAAMLPPPVM